MWTQETLHIFQEKTKHNTTQTFSVFNPCRQLYAQTMFTSTYTHHYYESVSKPRPLLEASCYVCFSLDRGRSTHCCAHAQSHSISALLTVLVFEWNFEFIRFLIELKFDSSLVCMILSISQPTNSKIIQPPLEKKKIRNYD